MLEIYCERLSLWRWYLTVSVYVMVCIVGCVLLHLLWHIHICAVAFAHSLSICVRAFGGGGVFAVACACVCSVGACVCVHTITCPHVCESKLRTILNV